MKKVKKTNTSVKVIFPRTLKNDIEENDLLQKYSDVPTLEKLVNAIKTGRIMFEGPFSEYRKVKAVQFLEKTIEEKR